MSLLNEAYENVVLMEKRREPDGEGGFQIGLKALFFKRLLHLIHQWKVELLKSKV